MRTRTRFVAVAVAAVLGVAACSSAQSGTGHGAASVSAAGGFHAATGSASSASPSGHASSSGAVSANWIAHTNFATQSHPDMRCAAAHEGGRVDVFPAVAADVTGDGLPEAIVRAECAHGASEWPDSVYVYSDASGTPTLIGTLLTQSANSYATRIAPHGRAITLGLVTWSHYAAGCCPDLDSTQTFTWNGSSFTAGPRTPVLQPCGGGAALPIATRNGGGAAGHAGLLLIFHNLLPQACTLTGYPGVDAERSGGMPVHAMRSSAGIGVHTVTLPANGYASAVLFWDTVPTGTIYPTVAGQNGA
jgi:hypothetical protein